MDGRTDGRVMGNVDYSGWEWERGYYFGRVLAGDGHSQKVMCCEDEDWDGFGARAMDREDEAAVTAGTLGGPTDFYWCLHGWGALLLGMFRRPDLA